MSCSPFDAVIQGAELREQIMMSPGGTTVGHENVGDVAQNTGIAIRRMAERDILPLVRLHANVFPGYNATVMGDAYLKGLYRTLSSDKACISIVAARGENIVGWIGGVGDWLAFEKALAWNSISKAPAIFFSILKNRPKLLAKAFPMFRRVVSQCLGRFTEENQNTPERGVRRSAALLVIGVKPQRQRQRVGQLMMNEFHRLLHSRGFAECSVNTFTDNVSANRAFVTAGYTLMGGAVGMNKYVKDLVNETTK